MQKIFRQYPSGTLCFPARLYIYSNYNKYLFQKFTWLFLCATVLLDSILHSVYSMDCDVDYSTTHILSYLAAGLND
jgi:hypothetical protein